MKKLLFCCFIFISFVARADYLVTNRSCNLKETNITSSATILHLNEGDTLLLFDEPQVNGYYHVAVHATGAEGWVYRTYVRRFAGFPAGASAPTGGGGGGTGSATGMVEVRIVDVGAGQCNLIKLPNNKYIIYDAGGIATSTGNNTIAQIKDFIPAGSEVELMVLSHTDADHIVAAEQAIRTYRIKKVLWTGYERSMVIPNKQPTVAYNRLIAALHDNPSTENINLNDEDSSIVPGNKLIIGNAKITFLCGFGKPPTGWNLTDHAEKLNSVSIVMKLEFGNNSVLFCGDAVGRHLNDNENALIATEKFLVDNASQFLKSTIIIAPHHGAKNGSSRDFVNRVQPQAVIFSAGNAHHHPTDRTAAVYLNTVDLSKIFRTDRGDDEGSGEWTHLRVTGCTDQPDDDHIQIELKSNGTFRVFYLKPEGSCINN